MEIRIPIIILLLAISLNVISGNTKADEEYQKNVDGKIHALLQQIMLQQFYTEQRVRSEGHSGLNVQRLRSGGTKNYFTETHTGRASAAIHEHANSIHTVGMGEFSVVLNGVEFTTRHNDYKLVMPHRTKKSYHATENIPFPDVPEEVTQKETVQEQIDEMREWFKAWSDQDSSVRDYRNYFKPVLCYLEGAWIKPSDKIEEPFTSDRHFLDATTWMDLHRKTMYTAYSGSKSIGENFSFLPSKIIDILNDTIPVFAQWSYRILCHPLKKDLPLDRLRIVEDLSSRMMTQKDIHKHKQSRAARFQLNTKNKSTFYDRPLSYELLDEMMEEIPGKDNYLGKMIDEGLEFASLNYDGTKKDVSRYHRWFKSPVRDAMGTSLVHRGYNDHMMFAAMTTQEKVANIQTEKCVEKSCRYIDQKWTYAIPLEIIYLTPLSRWNPYDITYHGFKKHSDKSNPVKANGRTGSCMEGANKEYNGTSDKIYFITPDEFFTGGQVEGTEADTAKGARCVLDSEMKSRKVRAAGTRVFFPYIKDVGVLRQRYPIYPVHGEGSSVWKEVNALREVVMDMQKWKQMIWNYKDVQPTKVLNNIDFQMEVSNSNAVSQHTHFVEFTATEMEQCRGGQKIYKTTSTSNGHEHDLEIQCNDDIPYYTKCGSKSICWDKHGTKLLLKDF